MTDQNSNVETARAANRRQDEVAATFVERPCFTSGGTFGVVKTTGRSRDFTKPLEVGEIVARVEIPCRSVKGGVTVKSTQIIVELFATLDFNSPFLKGHPDAKDEALCCRICQCEHKTSNEWGGHVTVLASGLCQWCSPPK